MPEHMEIILARHAGFCMGVRRALNLCLDVANDPASPRPIVTLGPLIHNSQVLKVLEQKGVRQIVEEDPVEQTGTAVIRAHGISPGRREDVRKFANKIIDATCPHVSKVQNIVKKYAVLGYKCIIVGDPGHAEVEGVMSYSGGMGILISSPEEAKELPVLEKTVVVAQTTQNKAVFDEVAAIVKSKSDKCKVFDTICRATQNRQNEAIKLARQVQAMVVVGGYNSANTRRLVRICADTGTPVYHVETEKELPLDDILKLRKLGITAGASTPSWMIKRVINKLRVADEKLHRPKALMLKRLLATPVRTNIFLGGGAACMTYAAFALLPLSSEPLFLCMLLAFCFIVSQHLLHQFTKRKAMLLNEPERGIFLESNAFFLAGLGVVAAAVAVAVSFTLGPAPLAIVLIGTAAGGIYCIPEKSGEDFSIIDRFRKLAGAKEFFVAIAWAATTVLIPFLSAGNQTMIFVTIAFAIFAGLTAFHRTLLTDMRDLEGDQITGRETLAVALGPETAIRILIGVCVFQFFLLLGSALAGWISIAGYGMMLVPFYCLAISLTYLNGRLPEGEAGEAMADAAFYLAALAAYVGSV